MSASPNAQDIVAALLEARLSGQALPAFPAPVPATLADAYAAQHKLRVALGRPVLGWKLGRVPPPLVASLGATRLAGPVLHCADLDGENPGEARIFVGGASAIEIEVMLRLRSVPDHRIDSDDEALTYVEEVRAGFEVASSPAPDVFDYSPFGTIADVGINNGLLLGPQIDLADFDEIEVSTEIDGVHVGTGRPSGVLDGPLGSLRFLVNLHHDGVITLEPGQWISAGAITGVHPIAAGQTATAQFGTAIRIACTTIPDTGYPR
ncbi:2-keto-4-pentenoate hydratase [Sphingopyxis witflariensis]|uniref:2-keto-4-pentenoate hydratase n=1 Tax=Sphingopyxis witflariensis TaxID=173675 RepID=A0A246K4R9_9SPHN|nr:2-keto-4-pentenoate hydratase [Sphingopyxis witflariensis]OWR00018.1 2-keto-4-pentenoate hydratase [Sphingopyxis witflariensis]